jgi:gliding motility-associated-like protein
MIKQSILFLALVILSISDYGQVITPFTVRKTITQKGGIVFLSNTSSKATPDNVVQDQMPPSGTGYDNNYTNAYVDIDGDATTFMSSSDQLNLTQCSEISWAGLYWGGEVTATNTNYAKRNLVKLKINSSSYIDLTADYLKDNSTGFKTYHCFKDITSIMKANGLTDLYTVANVVTDIGGKNLFGGWTIVVVYKNNTQTMRNLTVFDGLANVMSGTYSTVDIPISGFQTPLSGPVTFDLGLVVYDGDRSLTGDQLMFKGASNFINLSDALHPSTDMFNSTLARYGVLTPLRNPSYNNTLGYDANIFSPDNTSKNYIGNNAISAIIRQTTGGETYLTQVVTSAIDVYEPDLRAAVRVKNLTHPGVAKASPADILEYTITGMNIGSDPSVNTYINDTIEGNAQYIPGSLKIIYGNGLGTLTDDAGDDQGEYISSSKVVKVRIGTGANASTGGYVNNSPTGTDSTQYTFQVQATTDCVYLMCDSIIDNSAHIRGTGNISGNFFDNESNPGVFNAYGCPIPGTTKTPIATNGCSTPIASANVPVCQGGTLNFTATYSSSAIYSWTGPNSFTSALREPSITNVTSANAGVYNSIINITGTTCKFTYPFTVEINVANAGPDQTGSTTCGKTTATLTGNRPTGTSGSWSIISGTGGSFVDNTDPATTFSGVAGNSYTLRWTLNSGSCPSTADDVVITFNQGPSAAILSGTSSICYGNYATLKTTISGGTAPYTFTLDNSGGTYTNYTSGNDFMVGPLTSSVTYSLTSVTDANGCSATGLSGSAVITVSDAISGTAVITQNTAPSTSTSGPSYPGNVASSGSKYAWSNVNNAKASDNLWASQTISGSSTAAVLNLTNFGFAIPTNATIIGIEVVIDRHYTTTGTRTIRDKTIQLLKAGTAAGNNKAATTTDWPITSDLTATYPSSGGSSDLWGTTWTPSDINNTNFGIRIGTQRYGSSGNPSAYVDYASIKIYYTGTYCDNATSQSFTVSTLTNTTAYTWTAPTGGRIVSGQGTTTAIMDFNGAGQSGSYSVCVTASNNCQTASQSCITIPISDCANSSLYLMGYVYWDKNAMTDNLVNGTGIKTANSTQLYVTLTNTSGTAVQNSVAVASDGFYSFAVSASTNYKVVLSTISYTTGQTPAASLPSGCSNTGEIDNNVANTLTGNDGTVDGILSISGFTTNNNINANFGIKITTPPTASNDITSTSEDTQVTYNVTDNDTDVDGTVNVATVDLDPSTSGIQSSYTNTYGTWSVNSSGVVTFAPASNYNGTASVTYTVNDNDGNKSNTATLFITVSAVNDVPVATSNSFTIVQNSTYTFSTSDFKYSDVELDALSSITIATLPGLGTLKLSGVAVTNGQTISAANIANLAYIPITNEYGTPYTTFTYKVNDAGLGTVAGTITINVTHINVAPVAYDDAATTLQGNQVTFNILTNDINSDGTISTGTVDLDPLTSGKQTSFTTIGEGNYSVDGFGNITFTPLSTFYGTTTPINYTVDNSLGLTSNTASILVTVTPLGAPLAVDDAATVDENSSVTFNITNNDTDDGSINASRVDLDPYTAGIQQSYYVADQGQLIVDMYGNVTFTPDWNFYGTVVAYYTVRDNLNLTSNIATLTITVNWVNATPFAVDDYDTTSEDTPLTFNVLSNDYDLDGTLSASTLDLNPSVSGRQTSYSVSGEGTYTVDNAGNITFTPSLNFNGNATPIGYTIADNLGAVSDSGSIYISVTSVNDAPVAVNDHANAASNTNVVFNIVSNDTDVDGIIDATSIDLNPSYAGIQKTYTVSGEGTYTVDNSGNVTFTPLTSFVGPITTTTIYYTVKDYSGTISNSASISITLADPSAPQAVDDNASMNEDGSAITLDITNNDINGSGTIVVSTIDLDPSTTGQQTSMTTSLGIFSLNTSTGIVTFNPIANAYGSTSISYTVADDNTTPLVSNVATIYITILPVNDAPSFTKGLDQTVCENNSVQIVTNWAYSLNMGASNESTQTLSFIVTNNNNSLFSLQPYIDETGTLYYTPASNQYGSASVSVKVQDDGGTTNGGVDMSSTQTFDISVSQQPTPPITTASQSFCNSATVADLSASVPTGSVLNWYSSESDITTLTPTETLTTGLNYYAESQNSTTGCVSSSRTAVAVTINTLPSVPTANASQIFCGSATVASLSATAGSGGDVVNWFSSSSGGTALASTTALTTGTTYYTESQNSTSGCVSASRTAVDVTINTLPSAPTANASQTFCGSATVASLSATAGSGGDVVNWFSSSSGGTALASTTALTTATTYYAESQNSTTGCVSSSRTAVDVTVNTLPSAPTANASQTFCGSATVASLSATAGSGGDVVNWFSSSSGGSALTSTTALTTGTTYYAESQNSTSGCVSASRTAVDVTINTLPSAPTANASQTFCGSATVASLSATVGSGGDVVNWFSSSSGGTALASTTALTTATTYYAESQNSTTGCVSSSRTAVDVTVNTLPSAPTANASQTFCGSATVATLSATAGSGGDVVNWFDVASGGTALASTTALTTGTTYYAESQNSTTGCFSASRTAVDVTINTLPSAPTANASQAFCGSATVASLSATTGSGGDVVNWFSSSSGGTALASTTALTTATTYYAESQNSTTGCVSSSRTAVDVTINTLPSAPTANAAQAFCGSATVASLSATTGSGGDVVNWFSSSSGGTALASTTALTTGTTYYAESQNSTTGCVSSSRTAVDVTINTLPSAPTANASQTFCGSDTVASLSATVSSGGDVVNWFDVTTGGVALASTTALTTSTTYYAESQNSTTGCVSSSRTAVDVTINSLPSAPTANTSQAFCGSATVASLSATVGSGGDVVNWFSSSSGGTALTSTTALTTGTTYYAESQNSTTGCISFSRTAVDVTINTLPSAPTANASQTFCGSATVATLSATAGSGGDVVNWFSSSSGGTALASTTALTTSTTYYAESQNSTTGCISSSRTAVDVTINTLPSVPSANASQTFCGSATVATLSATAGSGGDVVNWFSSSSGGTALASTTALTTSTTYYAESKNSTTGCVSSSRTAVAVTINSLPSAPTANASQAFCGSAAVASLSATPGSGGDVVNWFSSSSGGTVLANTTALTTGTTYYAESQNSTTGCVSASRTAVDVTINTLPSAPTGSSAQNFCNANNPTVSDIVISGTNPVWYDAITAGNIVANNTSLVTGTAYYTSQTTNGCESSDRLAVTVTILSCAGPNITNQTLYLDENSANGTTVYDINDKNTGNDVDTDNKTITYSIVSGNDSGAFALDPATGIITVSDYTKLDFESIQSFILIIKAEDGITTDFATITIYLNNLNDNIPVAVADNYSVNEGGSLTVGSPGVLSNDYDYDNNSLTSILVSGPANGTLTLNSDGSFIYTHNGSETTSDTFSYKVNDGTYDGNTVTVILSINPVNDAPVLTNISKTGLVDNPIIFASTDFTSAFTDIENNSLTKIKVVSLPANGVLMLSGVTVAINDEITVNQLNDLIFVPSSGWTGSTSFAWNGFDGTDYSVTEANVNIIISATVNNPPVLTEITKSINEDNTFTFSASDFTNAFSDADGNNLTKIKITSLPANGTLLLSGVPVNLNDEISIADISLLTFVPNADWNGTTSFGWNGFDGTDYALTESLVNLNVSPVNDKPIVKIPVLTKTMEENGGSVTFDISSNSTDVDRDSLTVSISEQPAHGSVIMNNDGTITYTPDLNYSGTDTIVYNVCDNGTPQLCATGTIVVTIEPASVINHTPVINQLVINDTITSGSGSLNINILGNVTDPDNDTLTVSIVDGPAHGTITINKDGSVTYTPNSNFSGTDTIVYNVCDNGTPQLCATGTIVITVEPASVTNHTPVIIGYNKTTPFNTTLAFLNTDFEAVYTDADNDPLVKIRILVLPIKGYLTLNQNALIAGDSITTANLNALKYVPETGFSGNVWFTWEASDGLLYSNIDTVKITVEPLSEVFIPEGFSPNGDGINDYFVINGTDLYDVTLKVFNRWGNLVYEKVHYKNEWDGVSNKGLTINKDLPDGTYYYIVDFHNGEKSKLGYITINR